VTAWGSVAELLGDDLDDIDFLGRGSSGSVYRATQRSLGRTVAVKVFRRFADDETGRVISEAKAQAGLSWHANVVSLYSQGVTTDGFPYLVMEYAPGGSLQDRVRDHGPLSEQEWRRVGAELSSALAAAHDAGVVHCDVKPSNVLFAADGSVRLADFGIARATGMTSGTLDSIEGSLTYVPPELLDGYRPSAANDVYSLALTLGFAQSGNPPYPEGLTLAQAVAAVQSGRPSVELDRYPLDHETEGLLERSYAKDPETRPHSSELALALGDGGPTTHRLPATSGAGRPTRLWFGAAIVALLAVVGALIARSPDQRVQAVSDVEPVFDLCGEYAAFVRDREALLTGVSEELEQSASPTDVARKLVTDYPHNFAVIARPFIESVLSSGAVKGEVTEDQLAGIVIAENLRVLDGGKPFLFDGEGGEFDPAGLPVFLYEPARIFSEVNEHAVGRCPDVKVNIDPRKARLNSAIYSNLSNPQFMENFYSDPASYDVFDARVTLLMAAYAWDFFESLLIGHSDWLFELFSRNPDVRRVLSIERPEVLLRAVELDPSLSETLRQERWLADVQQGIDQMTPAARVGLSEVYAAEIVDLGLELT
jgi:hypothetical protein